LSQKYGSLGWHTGPDKFAKNSKTCPHCDVTFRKPKIEKEKKFLTCSLRLAKSIEGLNSSLAQSAGDLWLSKLLQNGKNGGARGTERVNGQVYRQTSPETILAIC